MGRYLNGRFFWTLLETIHSLSTTYKLANIKYVIIVCPCLFGLFHLLICPYFFRQIIDLRYKQTTTALYRAVVGDYVSIVAFLRINEKNA
jgi:hypothetical protein